ncbi:hypothetical protein ABIB95_005811 [Bradyrhizobium sp. LA2.1]
MLQRQRPSGWINARFPYTNPTGIKDIVSDSVEGLFREFSQPSSTPLP